MKLELYNYCCFGFVGMGPSQLKIRGRFFQLFKLVGEVFCFLGHLTREFCFMLLIFHVSRFY